MQIASTTLLLDGGREGEPPETKHRFVASWPTWQPLFFICRIVHVLDGLCRNNEEDPYQTETADCNAG